MSHLIVIGGTKGLGRAFVESLGNEYDSVTVLARSIPEPADRKGIRFIAANAGDRDLLHAGLEQAFDEGGALSAMALFQQFRGNTSPWESKLATTLTASKLALDFFAQHAVSDGDKAAVLLTSNASRFACDEQDAGYHAAKTGLLGLCRHYASTLGHLGIRVNCVSPGTVLKDESKHHYLDNPALLAALTHVIPLGRMGTANEVARAVKFLLSTDASFITGQELVVDGGASLRSQESLLRSWIQKNPAASSKT